MLNNNFRDCGTCVGVLGQFPEHFDGYNSCCVTFLHCKLQSFHRKLGILKVKESRTFIKLNKLSLVFSVHLNDSTFTRVDVPRLQGTCG